jgi:hypothetical protein
VAARAHAQHERTRRIGVVMAKETDPETPLRALA